jgi:predicted Zn-dependent protease
MTQHRIRPVRRLLVVPLLALVPLLGTGCANDRQIIGQANQFHAGLEQAVITDPQLTGYLQQVGDRIIAAAADLDRQGYDSKAAKKEDNKWMFNGGMQFHFVNSPTLNAFTTGGNHMYLYTGLFQNCETEDEMAAVMAHEFAHVYGRHVHKGMDRQMATMAAAAGAGAVGYAAGGKNRQTMAGNVAAIAVTAGQFFGQRFTRADETEADKMGFAFYTRAGWDPAKFDDFFQKMIDKGMDKTPEMLSDHPSLANRVAATKERVAKLPPEAQRWQRPAIAQGGEFRQLQQRSVAVGKTMPTSESLANAQELLRAMPRSCLTPRDQEALPDQREAQMNIIELLERRKQAAGGRAAGPARRVDGSARRAGDQSGRTPARYRRYD